MLLWICHASTRVLGCNMPMQHHTKLFNSMNTNLTPYLSLLSLCGRRDLSFLTAPLTISISFSILSFVQAYRKMLQIEVLKLSNTIRRRTILTSTIDGYSDIIIDSFLNVPSG